MNDGTDLVYMIIFSGVEGITTKAICVGEEEYNDYIKTHNVTGTRTMVLNPDSPKFKNSEEFMNNVYQSNYAIVDYYDDIPVTGYEEEMLIEAEGSFHQHIVSAVGNLKTTLEKDFIKFTKDESRLIQKTLEIIRSKADGCIDEEDVPDDDPYSRINIKELLRHSGVLD